MRPATLLLFLTAGAAVQASWFSGGNNEPAEYTTWTNQELQNWLDAHNVPYPSETPTQAELQSAVKAHWDSASTWTTDQYNKAQAAFSGLKQDTFDSWDESRLREFLLEQGVIKPSGPREQLVLLAKQKWRQYSSVASAYSVSASKSGSSIVSQASTAVYGDSWQQASKSASSAGHGASKSASSAAKQASKSAESVGTHASMSASSLVAQATDSAARALDDTKDYVYSTWDDNRIRAWLQEHGVVSPPATAREKLLAQMRSKYADVANPIWQAWSDSYIHHWLLSHGILKTESQKKRDELVALMNNYYYDTKSYVWDTWSESQMKEWLVQHNVIKSDAQVNREKMQKLLVDNYSRAHDTIWSSWKDSDMRQWLIDNGYMRSDAQKTRDDMVKLMNDKYTDYSSRAAAYLTWPDARLRAYLRESGISESALPTSRPGLLQEVRIRWVQGHHTATNMWLKVKEAIDSGVEIAEDKLGMVLDILTGGAEGAKEGAKDGKAKHDKVEL